MSLGRPQMTFGPTRLWKLSSLAADVLSMTYGTVLSSLVTWFGRGVAAIWLVGGLACDARNPGMAFLLVDLSPRRLPDELGLGNRQAFQGGGQKAPRKVVRRGAGSWSENARTRLSARTAVIWPPHAWEVRVWFARRSRDTVLSSSTPLESERLRA